MYVNMIHRIAIFTHWAHANLCKLVFKAQTLNHKSLPLLCYYYSLCVFHLFVCISKSAMAKVITKYLFMDRLPDGYINSVGFSVCRFNVQPLQPYYEFIL
jgi:hypothetical protein